MKPQSKLRTVAYPHRVLNKISIYLQEKTQVKRSDFTGYEGITAVDEAQVLVQSRKPITPRDGRVFDYVFCRIRALGEDNLSVRINTSEILEELDLSNRTANRQMVIDSLNNMIDVLVSLTWDSGEISFKMLESVVSLDGTTTIEITLFKSFIEAMDTEAAKTRYINISCIMTVKSQYSIELAKVLQMKGRGVKKATGAPNPIKEIDHRQLCSYLNLDASAKATHTQLRKAFNELESVKYPAYKYNSNLDIWKRQ